MSITSCSWPLKGRDQREYSVLWVEEKWYEKRPSKTDLAWAEALCCIHTRVAVWTAADSVPVPKAKRTDLSMFQPYRAGAFGGARFIKTGSFAQVAHEVYLTLCYGEYACGTIGTCTPWRTPKTPWGERGLLASIRAPTQCKRDPDFGMGTEVCAPHPPPPASPPLPRDCRHLHVHLHMLRRRRLRHHSLPVRHHLSPPVAASHSKSAAAGRAATAGGG